MGMDRQKTPPPVFPTKPVTTWGAIDLRRNNLGSCAAASSLPRPGSAVGLSSLAVVGETWRCCVTTAGPLTPRYQPPGGGVSAVSRPTVNAPAAAAATACHPWSPPCPPPAVALPTTAKAFGAPAYDQAAGLTTAASLALPLSPVTPARGAPLLQQPSESSSGPHGAAAGPPLQGSAAAAAIADTAAMSTPPLAASPERRPGKRPSGGGRWEAWDAWVAKRQRAAHQEPESLRSLLVCALAGPAPAAGEKRPRAARHGHSAAPADAGAAAAAAPPPPTPTPLPPAPPPAATPVVAPAGGPTAMAVDPGAVAAREDEGEECDSGTALENLAGTLRQRPQLLRLLLACEQRLSRPFQSFGKPPTPPPATAAAPVTASMGPPAPRPAAQPGLNSTGAAHPLNIAPQQFGAVPPTAG